MKNLSEIIKSFAPLVTVILLFTFTAKYTLEKVSEQSTKVQKLTKEKTVLSQKIKILSEISPSVNEEVTFVSTALPESNFSLITISQLRLKALENGLLLGSLKSGNEVKDSSGLNRVDIIFQVNGPKAQIITFLNLIPTISPITLVDKVKLTEVNESTRADITVKSFWSELPKTLPSVNQQITDLTEKESNLLNEVGNLIQPTFLVTSPSITGERADPFNQ